jgi:flagellum-specific peptidoglycan hydrolase FlgJ
MINISKQAFCEWAVLALLCLLWLATRDVSQSDAPIAQADIVWSDEFLEPVYQASFIPAAVHKSNATSPSKSAKVSDCARFVEDAAVRKYVSRFLKTAIEEERRYKIPAEVKLAQGIAEGNAGRSLLAVKAHNHFGIKYKGNTRLAIGLMRHKDDCGDNACAFRVYTSDWTSFRDHSLFLKENKRYRQAFREKTIYGFVLAIAKAGYATDKDYASKVMATISRNKLGKACGCARKVLPLQ